MKPTVQRRNSHVLYSKIVEWDEVSNVTNMEEGESRQLLIVEEKFVNL